MVAPCEDGIHLLTVAGQADLTRGTPAAIEARYRQALLDFPAVLNPRLLEAAELVSPVVGAPETMMRGYYRSPTGPGWALTGDAGHFKHPTTAQGIGDALAQAEYVAVDLLGGGDLAGYEQWRNERSTEAFEFSFRAARLPEPLIAARYAGLAADPVAGQQFLDTFTRHTAVSDVFTRARSRRWRAAAAYEDGLRRLVALLDGLSDRDLRTRVPACPLWSVHDLVAHLCGVAEDSTHGRFFAGAAQAWADPALAAQREAWTAGQVEARRGFDRHQLVAELERHGQALVRAMRRGDTATTDVPAWMLGAPVTDLAAHLGDLYEALMLPDDTETLVARYGFASFRALAGRTHRRQRTRTAAPRRSRRPCVGVGARRRGRARRVRGGGPVPALPRDQRETSPRGGALVVVARGPVGVPPGALSLSAGMSGVEARQLHLATGSEPRQGGSAVARLR